MIIGYGPRGRPIARILKELLTEWFRALRNIARVGHIAWQNLVRAWRIARSNLAGKYSTGIQHDKVLTVKASHGIMHNVIIWLYKLGWNPMHVSRWVAPDGSKYVISNLNCPSHLVVLAAVDSYNAIKLKHAAKHRNGKGMEMGLTTIPFSNSRNRITSRTIANLCLLSKQR